jgi:ribosome-associated protein
MLLVTSRIQIPEDELEFQFSRSGGPGGQNVNKVSSKATLRFHVTTSPSVPEDVRKRFLQRFASKIVSDGSVLISAEASRSQLENRSACLEQLATMLRAVATPPKKRVPTKPTRGSTRRRLDAKRIRSETKRARGSRNED